MMKHKRYATLALTTLALAGLYSSASATSVEERAYGAEVRSCVAEIRNHVDLDVASRVRHDVTLVKPKLVGYVMRIDTTIYTEKGDTAPRAYATRCVVNGDHKPLKFEIAPANGA